VKLRDVLECNRITTPLIIVGAFQAPPMRITESGRAVSIDAKLGTDVFPLTLPTTASARLLGNRFSIELGEDPDF
jgi:hypothetical protein